MTTDTTGTVANGMPAAGEALEVPEVSTYGVPSGGGARASFFKRGALTVTVTGLFAEHTEPAFEAACELARASFMIATLTEENEALIAELRAARADIPPARGARLLGRGYVRFAGAELWILNNRERGFGHFGFQCDGWDDLFRRYDVRVVESGRDEHGDWWAVESTTTRTAGSK